MLLSRLKAEKLLKPLRPFPIYHVPLVFCFLSVAIWATWKVSTAPFTPWLRSTEPIHSLHGPARKPSEIISNSKYHMKKSLGNSEGYWGNPDLLSECFLLLYFYFLFKYTLCTLQYFLTIQSLWYTTLFAPQVDLGGCRQTHTQKQPPAYVHVCQCIIHIHKQNWIKLFDFSAHSWTGREPPFHFGGVW